MARRGSLILGRGLLVACLLAAPGAADQPAGGSQRLAFVADRDGAQDLHVLDVTRLTTTRLASGHSQIDAPVWAPDGSRLAFASISGAASSIFAVNGDGTGLRRLASGRNPAWSPDGTRIAFATTESDDEDIFVLSLDTSKRRRVTTHSEPRPFAPVEARWRPDRLRFVAGRQLEARRARVRKRDLRDGRGRLRGPSPHRPQRMRSHSRRRGEAQ